MKITQVRNATRLLDYAGTRFLIDPMISAKGAFPALRAPRTANCAIRWSNCPAGTAQAQSGVAGGKQYRIAELVGFKSATSLRNHFRARFAISPSEWRRSFRGHNP